MVSRRTLLGRIAAGAALACMPGAVRVSGAIGRVEKDAVGPSTGGSLAAQGVPETPETMAVSEQLCAPWGMVRPLAAGAAVGHGWRVANLGPVRKGSILLTMRTGLGREQQVRICRNDGQPQGIVHTGRFDLLVVNGAKGNRPTEEGVAQAVARLGHVIAANEGHLQGAEVAGLLSHREWVRVS